MRQYHDLLNHILTYGTKKGDRTNTGTISTFGYQMRYDLSEGLPVVTTKRIHLKSVIHELLWFISGDTNTKYLTDNGVTIWDEWSDNGELGPIYGHQWRFWDNSIDQLSDVIHEIKTNPDSRRLCISAWNPTDIPYMKLPPCHVFFQFYVSNYKLSCQLYQRSGDAFLGIPFNIASYAILTHMIAHECKLDVGDFVHTIGDAHIYLNHVEQVYEQLKRTPKELPTLILNSDIEKVVDFRYEDIEVRNYNPDPPIKAPVAV